MEILRNPAIYFEYENYLYEMYHRILVVFSKHFIYHLKSVIHLLQSICNPAKRRTSY